MFNKIYAAVAGLAVGYYALGGLFGWEYGNPQRNIVPADARRSPGWSHSRTGTSHFWYSGYRGGK
jgi:hypothetical protein